VNDDELREQLALAAVGALSADERTELDDVLRTRPDLRAELDELEAAAMILGDALGEAPPPPALRANILDAIAATPQLPASAPPPDTTADPESDGPIAPVVPIGSRRRNRWVAIGSVAAAVIVLLVAALVVSPWSSDGNDSVAAVLDSEDAQTIAMPGTGESGSLPGLTIVHSASEDAAVLMADEVPVPEGDRVYELWAIRDGTPERFATFRPDDSGQVSVYAAGLDPTSADQWAITEEPAGGSDAPTSPILNATV
jgi:anti-sigma-K factor RskA